MNVIVILVLSGTLIVLGASNQAPRFVVEPSDVFAPRNSFVVFNCSTRAKPRATIVWLKDGVQIRGNSRLVTQPSSGALHIKSVRGRRRGLSGDEGLYQCLATNSAGTTASRKASLRIAFISKKFKEHPKSISTSEATNVYFSCKIKRAVPPAQISWQKDGHPVRTSIRHRILTNGTLQIFNVQSSDQGRYRCVASNIANNRTSNYGMLSVKKVPNPHPPRNVTGIAQSSSEVLISWLAPRGLSVLGYAIHYQPADKSNRELQEVQQASQTSSRTSKIIRNLIGYTNYTFYIKPYHKKKGEGHSSNVITVCTLSAKPTSSPENVALASFTPDSIDVNWDPPMKKYRNGLISSYIIKYFRMPGGAANPNIIELPGSIQTKTINGLQRGKNYSVQIAAATKIGWGPFSKEKVKTVTTQLPDLISTPYVTVKAINSSALEITWSSPLYGANRVREYRLFYGKANRKDGSKGPTHLSKNTKKFTIINLSPNTKYMVRLMAWDGKKTGQSEEKFGTTLLSGGSKVNGRMQVECTAASPTSISVRISWQRFSNSRSAAYYSISYGIVGNLNKDREMTLHVVNAITNIKNLRPGGVYHIKVKAFDTNRSAISAWVHTASSCQTSELAPETPPRNFKYSIMSETSVDLQWEPPIKPNGKVSHYQIAYTTNPKLPDENWIKKKEVVSKIFSRFEEIVTVRLAGLTSNVTFYIKVRAGNNEGYGPWTDVMKVPMVVPEKDQRDDAPVLSFQYLSLTSIEVSWPTPISYKGKANSYLLRYTTEKHAADEFWEKRSCMVGYQHPLERKVVVQLASLTPNKTYFVKVRADYGTQYGPWSKVIEISMHEKDNPTVSDLHDGNGGNSTKKPNEQPRQGPEKTVDFEVKLGIIIGCVISAFCVVMLVLFIIWRCPCRHGAKKQEPAPLMNGKPLQNGYMLPPHNSSHQTMSSTSTGHSTGSTYEEGSAGSSISNTCQCRCTCSASRWPPVSNMPKRPPNQVTGNGHVITGNGQVHMTQNLEELRKAGLQNDSKGSNSNVANGHVPNGGVVMESSVPLEVLSDGRNGGITVPRRPHNTSSISVDV